LYNIGMSKMTTAEARKSYSDLLNRASYSKERVSLTRHGKAIAVLVPVEDVELLEELENRRDAEDARKALAEFRASGEKAVPLAQLKRRR
jgi:prevent-host-death family protein